jgi:hypothetical protein
MVRALILDCQARSDVVLRISLVGGDVYPVRTFGFVVYWSWSWEGTWQGPWKGTWNWRQNSFRKVLGKALRQVSRTTFKQIILKTQFFSCPKVKPYTTCLSQEALSQVCHEISGVTTSIFRDGVCHEIMPTPAFFL